MNDEIQHSTLPWHAEWEEATEGRGIAICAANGDIALVIDPEMHADERDIGNAELVCRAVNHHSQLIRNANHLIIEIENTFPLGIPSAALLAWVNVVKETIVKAQTETPWPKIAHQTRPKGSPPSEKS